VASAGELLRQAAQGRLGVDKPLIQSILDGGSEAAQEVLAFANSSHDQDRIDLDPLLVDLFHYWGTPEALDFLIEAVRRTHEDVNDELVQTLLPFGERAVEPLLKLYEELGEEQGSDIAFLLAGLRVHDPRVLAVLLDRLQFDAADGALCLELYHDPTARPALETMLAEIPAEEVELRRDLQHAIEELDKPAPPYEPIPFDIMEEYPKRQLPAFEVLSESERLQLFDSPDAEIRAAAAHSFFNQELDPKTRATLLRMAQSDPDAKVRGRAWESLADATEDAAIRNAMLAVLTDTSQNIDERGGAAVGLYAVADRDDVNQSLIALYEEDGVVARAKALESMWRSLWKPYARFFPQHLDDANKEVLRQAIRGAGYFQLTRHAGKIASYFDRDDDLEDLREDALFAYAVAMPGETTRGRIRGMLRKIDSLAHLSSSEAELVMFALDERLRLAGLNPVFATAEESEEEEEYQQPSAAAPPPSGKVGRNDPCPCGSGKKYKKCHGA
jgi:hypothetical protein